MRSWKKIALSLCTAQAVAMAAFCQEDSRWVKAPHYAKEAEQAIPATKVTEIGGFAGDRINKNKDHFLKTFPIDNYIRLVEQRSFTAWDWRKGEQPGKWLESAILTATRTEDAALEREARDVYGRMLHAQAPDGYLGITADSIRTPEKPLRGMDAYELYFTQHALLTAYEIWRDPKGLQAAAKLGDYFIKTIGPGKAEFWPSSTHYPENKGKTLKGTMHSDLAGHSIHYSWEGTLLIDPMMRLYELTGDKRYLNWCKWVVSNIDKWSGWETWSNLDKVAAGEITVDKIQPYVHTHTFQMNFLGLLRMYQCTGDSSYLRKVVGVWNDVAARQLYITGGVSVGEHYERDFIKPLTGEMMETCATMSWMQLSQYLLDLTGDPKYADAMEKIGWNQVFAEQTIDGDANHYFTPPNGYTPKGYFREPDCCMGSGHRLLSMLPGFIYAGSPGNIYINQYMSSVAEMGKIRFAQQTDYPQDGKITVTVDPIAPVTFTVNLRIPAWCKGAALAVNGKEQPAPEPGTYARITRTWHAGDRITLELPMELKWVRHDHYNKTSDRKPYKTQPDNDAPYALVRGPVVYALDDIWYKGDTADFARGWMDTVKYVLVDAAGLKPLPAPEKDILGPGYEVPIILGNGKKTSLPVYPFANIGKWYKDPAHKPDSNAAAWTYAIWLKGAPAAASATGVGTAGLTLPKILGNNMVLQRDRLVPVWGTAAPGSAITVTFSGQTKKTIANTQGQWKLLLDPMPASAQPQELVVTASLSGPANAPGSATAETIHLQNILIGEVWLCSGQSNMEYSMRKNSKFEKAAHGSAPEDELNKANNPAIRIFLVRNNYSKPDSHIRRAWDTASGAPLRDFSAAGYFFAKELYKQLRVPIGVISASVPGSAIEPFLPPTGDTSRSRGKFYETMIRPLAPFAIKGFLWYQGETNCFLNDTLRYPKKMEELIGSWRQCWAGTNLPFYFVQIAPFYYSHSTGGDQPHSPTTEPAFWEAQEKAISLPHTGMVVTTDLVDSLQDLHPAYKWEIGRRLALWALANDYGHHELACSGPIYRSMVIKQHQIELTFTAIGSGLISRDGKPLDWWEVAGADGNFIPAKAVIKGDKVLVSARGLSSPVAVRFGWNEAAQPNFYNLQGLPALPFR
ncbi:MAG TPA: beta-L-arabinofuranosidase domain-containing protein, partial [Puia sp.]|nr:beta-L-arabinofuranosidase domain-containing protein [Puia sp.]